MTTLLASSFEAAATPLQPFTVLFDDRDVDVANSLELPPSVQQTYGSPWRIPANTRYCYANFALSRDGRISYNEPDHMGGGDVSGFNRHDQWLMGLLRARADAVIMGDRTLQIEPEHLWTSAYIFPDDAGSFAALRKQEGRKPTPLAVFLSLTGDILPTAHTFQQDDISILIATTKEGEARANAQLVGHVKAHVEVMNLENADASGVDLPRLMDVLEHDCGVFTSLCEGGPRAYASMIAAGLINDEFLALCPNVIGSSPDKPRPGLIEGVSFSVGQAPQSQPVSLHKAGHHMFLRSEYVYA
ncbi:MAG: dihydrofolate reductase family protein [Deinococcota bacterium]